MKRISRITDFVGAAIVAAVLWFALMIALGAIWGAGITAFRLGFKLITNLNP